MNSTDFSNLSRPLQPMPDFVRDELDTRGLMEAYKSRPPYQQNDYLSWINRAKRPATREKRLLQMLDELARGDVYMKMPYKPRGGDRQG
jgi:uncharacterized protein YdeI (YjbR/CyaY-like superfamily)